MASATKLGRPRNTWTVRLFSPVSLGFCLLAFLIALAEFLRGMLEYRGGDSGTAADFSVLFSPLTLLGILLAVAVRWKLRREFPKSRQNRMALIAFVLGAVALLLIPAILFVSRPAPQNPAFAVGSLRTIVTSNIQYQNKYGGYAPSLLSMGREVPSTESTQTTRMLDPELSSGHKYGYKFEYAVREKDPKGTVTRYSVSAVPEAKEGARWPSFFVDEKGVIRFENKGPATERSPALQ